MGDLEALLAEEKLQAAALHESNIQCILTSTTPPVVEEEVASELAAAYPGASSGGNTPPCPECPACPLAAAPPPEPSPKDAGPQNCHQTPRACAESDSLPKDSPGLILPAPSSGPLGILEEEKGHMPPEKKEDSSEHCVAWAKAGECDRNPKY